MDESAHPNKPDPEPPTPEVDQLLKMIELQTEAHRVRRGGAPAPFQSVSFRWGSIVVVVIFALGSIGVMEWILSQLPKPAAPAANVVPAIPVNSGTASSITGEKPGSAPNVFHN